MKRGWLWIWILALLFLGGCSGSSIEELYCLPEASEDYYDLQEALSAVLAEGYSYHAPSSGARREPVQLVDLDGDGVDEAVAFLRSTEDGAVVVRIFSKKDEVYQSAGEIPCSGSAVSAVEYVDLDGGGDLELLITCQVSQSVTQALQVSRYRNGETESLLTTACGRYSLVDLNDDGTQELLCITDSGDETAAQAAYYTCEKGQLGERGSLRLSAAFDSILDIQEGILSGGAPVLLITSENGEQQVTDALIQDKGALSNLEAEDILTSAKLRDGNLYPQDIDGDGETEIPLAVTLPAYGEGSTTQLAVEWYSLDADGGETKKLTTYHDLGEGWYLTLPEAWEDQITVKKSDTVESGCTISAVSFYRLEDSKKPGEEILTLYVLRGASRQRAADSLSLTTLLSDTDVIIGVALNEEAETWEGTLTMAQVSERFHTETASETVN